MTLGAKRDRGGGFTGETASPAPAVRFAGLRFHPVDVDEALRILTERPVGETFSAFVTPNAEHVLLRRKDAEFAACGDTCLLSSNDSRILLAAARLGGLDLKFAPGAHVVDRLFKDHIDPDTAISVIGGTPEVIEALRVQFGLTRLFHHNPPMGFINMPEAVAEAVAFVVANPAQYVMVAMGPPQSEKFCQRVIAAGGATGIGLCIGSSINVLTGHSQAAPDWVEGSGTVWLYRLMREPRRLWKRYLVRGMQGLAIALVDAARLRLGLRKAADVG